MAPFGSSARRLQGDVLGSAERAPRPHSASHAGFQPSRKSFFQSLDAAERAALLKVAPSLRCARQHTARITSHPNTSARFANQAANIQAHASAFEPVCLLTPNPRPACPLTSYPSDRVHHRATFQTPARGTADLEWSDDHSFDRGLPDTKTSETQTLVPPRMISTAGSPPSAHGSPESPTKPVSKPTTRPPRAAASAATARRPKHSTPSKPTTPPPAKRARSPPLRAGTSRSSPGTSPRTPRRGGVGGTLADTEQPPRGFDRELTRDFAKREVELRFEVEKWRARAEALAEENAFVRAAGERARRVNAESEGNFSLQSRTLDRLREEAVWEGAAKAAKLVEQCERQRRALRELAVASEALVKDNVLLTSELVTLRDRGDEAEARAETLADRLNGARKLYLAGQKSLQRAEETRGVLPDGRWEKKLNQLLTADVLHRSKPPSVFPVDAGRNPLVAVSSSYTAPTSENYSFQNPKAGGGVPGSLIAERRKLHVENEALRKALRLARATVTSVQETRFVVNSELAAARKDGGAKAARLQSQLAGAARRLRWLVGRVESLECGNREKDGYAASLEKRLLAQHATMGKVTGKAARSIRETEERELERGWKSSTGGKAGTSGGTSADITTEPLRKKTTNPALASAVSYLKSGSADSLKKKTRGDGWVAGSGARTPTARDALRLARAARVRLSSPSGKDAFDEGAVDDDETSGGDENLDETNESRDANAIHASARVVDFDFDSTPRDVTPVGKGFPSIGGSPTRPSGGNSPFSGSSPVTPSAALGPGHDSPHQEPDAAEKFSMDGIEAYIANLQSLHRKSTLAVKTPEGKKR